MQDVAVGHVTESAIRRPDGRDSTAQVPPPSVVSAIPDPPPTAMQRRAEAQAMSMGSPTCAGIGTVVHDRPPSEVTSASATGSLPANDPPPAMHDWLVGQAMVVRPIP
jgi:hypothetical protein